MTPKAIACALGEVSDAAGGRFSPVPKGCDPFCLPRRSGPRLRRPCYDLRTAPSGRQNGTQRGSQNLFRGSLGQRQCGGSGRGSGRALGFGHRALILVRAEVLARIRFPDHIRVAQTAPGDDQRAAHQGQTINAATAAHRGFPYGPNFASRAEVSSRSCSCLLQFSPSRAQFLPAA